MKIKLRYLSESLLTYGLIFLVVNLDVATMKASFFPVHDMEVLIRAFLQAFIFVLVYSILVHPESLWPKTIAFGVGASLLSGSFEVWTIGKQVVVSVQYLVWSVGLQGFFRLYLSRTQVESLNPIQLMVKDDKIGIVIPMKSTIKWFPPSGLAEAVQYVSLSAPKGCSEVRYDYLVGEKVSLEQLRNFGNSLISRQPKISA